MKKPSNWDRYLAKKMADSELRAMVGEELESLRLGVTLAKLRQEKGLTQEQLARRCGMKAPNISRIENDPAHNVTVGTLTRICRAMGYNLDFTPRPLAAPGLGSGANRRRPGGSRGKAR